MIIGMSLSAVFLQTDGEISHSRVNGTSQKVIAVAPTVPKLQVATKLTRKIRGAYFPLGG